MKRNEFLKILKESLDLSLDKEQINAQLDYYDKYISDEIKKGRTESEVLDELGDPRLIAKTIKTVEGTDMVVDSDSSSNNHNKNGSESSSRSYGGEQGRKSYTYVSNTGVIGCVILLLVFFIIAVTVLKLLGFVAIGVTGAAFGLGPFGILMLLLIFWLLFSNRR